MEGVVQPFPYEEKKIPRDASIHVCVYKVFKRFLFCLFFDPVKWRFLAVVCFFYFFIYCILYCNGGVSYTHFQMPVFHPRVLAVGAAASQIAVKRGQLVLLVIQKAHFALCLLPRRRRETR